uniref:Genome polyprotein n=1 Tax=Guangdong pseudohemiculter dispar calicivirus TaxID=2116386 RepID=A0A2P1GMM4_9CALI|nr:polyprotein [Guangdong pseudohemiculter dispar calicivirus]
MSQSKSVNTNSESIMDSELSTSSSSFKDLVKRNPLANLDTFKEGSVEVLTAVNQVFDVVKPVTLAHLICELLGHTSRWTVVRCVAQLMELYKGPLITHWHTIVEALRTLAELVSRKDGDSVQAEDPAAGVTAAGSKKATKGVAPGPSVVVPTQEPSAKKSATERMHEHMASAMKDQQLKFAKWRDEGKALMAKLGQKNEAPSASVDLHGPVALTIDTEDPALKQHVLQVLELVKIAGAKFDLVDPTKAELFLSPVRYTDRAQANADLAAISAKKGTRAALFFANTHPKLDDMVHEARVHVFGWKLVDGNIGTGTVNQNQTTSLYTYLSTGEGKCKCTEDECVNWHEGTLQDSFFRALKGAYDWGVETMVGWVGAILAGLVALSSLFPENKLAKKIADRFLSLVSNSGKLHSAKDESLYAFESVKNALSSTVAPAATLTLKEAHMYMQDVKSLLQRRPHMLTHPAFPIDSVDALYEYAATKATKGKSIGAKCWADIMCDCANVKRAYKERFLTQTRRPEPVVVCLAGPPGVGKTTVVRLLADEVNRIFGTVGYDAWQCGLDHQDQMNGKPLVTMEEFGMAELSKDQIGLQRMADSNPFVTDNDLIQNKGRHEAPAVLVLTTNCKDIYKGFADPDALARRVTHHILVKNPGLEAWKRTNPGKTPTDQEYKTIFAATPSEYFRLPVGACDWDGNYMQEGVQSKLNPVQIQLAGLSADVIKTVKERWADVLEDVEEVTPKLKFHVRDVPVVVFKGPPGCGKTTLADTLSDQFDVVDDIWVKKGAFETLVAHVMTLEATSNDKPALITTNSAPWKAELDKMEKEARIAFERRLTYYEFSFRRKGVIGRYNHEDMKELGWSRIVDVVGPDKCHLTYTTLIAEIRSLVPKPKTTSQCAAPIQTEAYVRAAESNMTVAQVGAAKDPMQTLLSFKRYKVPGLNVLSTMAEVFRQVSIQGNTKTNPESLVCSVNDAKLKLSIPPCSVKFADSEINFWSYHKTLRSALVQTTAAAPSPGAGFTSRPAVDPFEFDQVVEDQYELPRAISGAILNVMTTVLGMVAMAMEQKVVFHTPTNDNEKGPGRRPFRNYKSVKDSDFQVSGRSWSDDKREMDYTERISFDSNNWIVPCYDIAGSPKGWAVSTRRGLLANRHVIAGTTKIGHQTLGESVVLNYGDTDLCLVKPVHNPYQICKIPFSRPVIGETLYQLKPSGMQRARVHGFMNVASPSGKLVEVCLVEGGVSEPGDCGLPWVRKVGQSVELVGLAAGTRGQRLMVVPLRNDPDEVRWHSRTHNYTFLHKTQYAKIDPALEDMSPSDKVWGGEGEDGMVRHCSSVFFEAAASNAVTPNAVAAAKEYINRLVPEERKERWSVIATVKSLDMDTAAGPSYGTYKHVVFNADGVPVQPYAGTFWRGVNNPCEGRCRISIKDELRPERKRVLGLSRPIFCFDVHDTVRVKANIGAGLQHLADTCGSHIWSVGISQQNGSWAEVCRRLSKWRYVMDADFGRWDSTNSHPLLHQSAEVLSELALPEFRAEVLADLKRLISAQTQLGPTRTGLPSGLVCTAQMNCTSHLLTINDILLENGAAPVGFLGCPLDFVSYGDDIVLAMDDKEVAKWLTDGWARRGFVATNAKKTGPPECTSLGHASFIKRSFLKVEGEWRAPLEELSIWKGLAWMRGHMSYDHTGGTQSEDLVGSRAVGVFQALMSEFWQHGKSVYDGAKKRLVEYAREHRIRLPVNIPVYDLFRPRDVLNEYNRDVGRSSVVVLAMSWHVGGTGEVQPVSSAEAPGGENVGEVVGLPALATGLAHPTAGIETAVATSGGPTVQLDPAIRERFVMVPGGMVAVRTNMTRGSVVWRKKISPSVNMWINLLSCMYNAWCGGFEIMVVVGANNFIGGKFLVAYFPPNVASSAYSVEQVTAFPHAILDVRLMDNVLLACSDIKYVLWHPTNARPEDPISSGGEVVIYLLTNIVTAGNSGNVMTLDMSIFSRPMPDFDFNFLMPIDLGGSGGPNDLEMQNAARALSTPATGGGRGWYVVDILVLSQRQSTVTGDIFATTVRMSGTSPFCIPYPAPDGMMILVVKESTSKYKLITFDRDGMTWDVGSSGVSMSLPPCWMAFNSDKKHTALTWIKTDGTLDHAVGEITFESGQPFFVPNTAADIPGSTKIAVTGTRDGVALKTKDSPTSAPSFTPNNGESVVLFSALSRSLAKGATLSTQEMINVFMTSPRITSMCGLFNMADATGATTVQVKLYPNGVLTAGNSSTTILYTGPITFTYVGMVPVDYKLTPPAGGSNAEVLDLVDRLDRWLGLQEQGLDSSQASSMRQLLSESPASTSRLPLRRKLEILDSDEESFETIQKL